MMNNFFPFGGFGLGLHLHFFFGFLVFLALVLFVVLALRYLKKEELVSWIKGLLMVGLIGWLLTASFGLQWGGSWGFSRGFGPGGMMGGVAQCAQDEECFNAMGQMMNRMGNFKNNAR